MTTRTNEPLCPQGRGDRGYRRSSATSEQPLHACAPETGRSPPTATGRYAELYIATPMRSSQLCAVGRRRRRQPFVQHGLGPGAPAHSFAFSGVGSACPTLDASARGCRALVIDRASRSHPRSQHYEAVRQCSEVAALLMTGPAVHSHHVRRRGRITEVERPRHRERQKLCRYRGTLALTDTSLRLGRRRQYRGNCA